MLRDADEQRPELFDNPDFIPDRNPLIIISGMPYLPLSILQYAMTATVLGYPVLPAPLQSHLPLLAPESFPRAHFCQLVVGRSRHLDLYHYLCLYLDTATS